MSIIHGFSALRLADVVQALNLKRCGREYIGACPACGYTSGFTACEKAGRLLLFCHVGRCSFPEILRAIQGQGMGYRESITPLFCKASGVQEKEAHTRAFIQRLWTESLPASGTLVETYLQGRGIRIIKPPEHIRFLASAWHSPTRRYYPAMLAGVTRWDGPEIIALHRTFLSSDGQRKADIRPNKMMLGRVAGGSVHLGEPVDALAIAEGIETALSVYQATGLPTWAALSTAGLSGLDLPPEVQEVILCADHDAPGLKAAQSTAKRWISFGKRIRIATPPQAGTDFNDVLCKKGGSQ